MLKIRVMVKTLVAVMLIPALSMAGDVVFIGNPSVPTTVLNKYDVKNIFLGAKTTWDDGSEIIFVVQKDSDCHTLFLKKYIRKTTAQFSEYWKKRIFTGKGLAPQSKANDEDIIKFVRETNGAIGYVSSDAGLENVKIIRVR